MNKKIFRFIVGLIILFLLVGCGGGGGMHKAKKKGPAGMPAMQPQTSGETLAPGVIKIDDEVSYPGMVSFEGAAYEFVAEDPPEKVVSFFTEKLKDAVINKKTGRSPSETEWVFLYKGYEIVVATGPKGSNTLIRYKLAQKEKKK